MQIELSPNDIEAIIREADAAGQRLRRKLCMPICEREDLGQDLLVDLLRRLPAYDPSRGSIGAFANIVLSNQSSRIAIRHHRQRRAQGGSLLSLEVPLAGSKEPVGDTLTEDDGLAAWHGQNCCAVSVSDDHHALEAALARLPETDRRLCAALADRPVSALAAAGFGSRSALYRRLADLRHVLTAHGLGPAWDDLVAA
ncbi:RNA polymerase sigma-70 factor (ECF subfamily) [Amaricoccus macauensis]|uniref:RNA polymerase sigma-70 factor (ECF subfamily) n=1 Tax=Amaricoccus macauensis TaxID=57001 RepID=A0A840SH79_9RHOB|nr:sigma factor [Amaricoccus macauensis]MBB5220100.1 RNA polymerase sigma-70 factor (ECF subfamily) [Amaricoccus macauensis]